MSHALPSVPSASQSLAFARSFGRVFGGASLALASLGAYRGWVLWWVAAIFAVAFLGLGHFAPQTLQPLSRLWAKVGDLLGRIMNPIILGIIFLVLFVPTGFFMKLIGRDALRRRLDPQAQSYWIARSPPGPPPESIKRPY